MNFAQRVDYVLSGDTPTPWIEEADAVSLPRLDEVSGHPRPEEIGSTYAEHEYQALADEQELAWPAEGERAARRFQMEARRLDRPTAAIDFLLEESGKEVQQAYADYQHAAMVLTPYVRREPGAKLRYWVCWPILWLGDTAGVWSAAITNGDLVYVAFGQAFAAGLAAVCAGLVGAELKDLRLARARRRDPDSLSDDEQRYQRLFCGSDSGIEIVKLVGYASLLVVALLGVGIFALRSGIEGGLSGLTFGLLAAATAIASGLLGYAAADDVADLLATTRSRVRRAEHRHLQLAGAAQPMTRAKADEAARSLHAEHHLRGLAAGRRVDSLSFRILRRNPQVVGHGYPVGAPEAGIGWRMRRPGSRV